MPKSLREDIAKTIFDTRKKNSELEWRVLSDSSKEIYFVSADAILKKIEEILPEEKKNAIDNYDDIYNDGWNAYRSALQRRLKG